MYRAPLLGLLCLAFTAACTTTPRAELLTVDEVGPTRLDDGVTLFVRGEGFPVGRRGQLVLRGHHHRPGAAPRAVEHALPVRVTGTDRAEHALDDDALRSLGGRGTFVGVAELTFEAAAGGRVVGEARAELDVGGTLSPAPELTAEFRRRLGLVLDDELPIEGGLVVREVTPGGAAADHGLAEGDRLVALGPLRLRSPDDLRPPPEGGAIVLHVERPGLEGLREVVLRPETRVPRDPAAAIVLALFAALVVAFGPGGRLLGALHRPDLSAAATLVLALAVAGVFHVFAVDVVFAAAFVVLPRLVDGWVARRFAGELLATTAIGAALAVGMLVRVDGGASSMLALRHPLSVVVLLAALVAAARPTRSRWLGVLARALGAVWLGSLFFGSPWVGAPLALLGAAMPDVRPSRVAALAWLSGAAAVALAFVVDLSAPAALVPEEPRVAWWLGAALAAVATLAWRRSPERRAHVFL
ncbi:MAG: PDZ domain-containing protein [Polyangiales bacterium]